MKPAGLTAAALLCIGVGLLTLALTAGRAEGASDPDDDTWVTADGIGLGLAGGSSGDLGEPAVSLPVAGVPAPSSDATGGDDAGPADVYDVESPASPTTREDSSGERDWLPATSTDDSEIADSYGNYATDDIDYDYDGGESDSGSGDTDYDYDYNDGEISEFGDGGDRSDDRDYGGFDDSEKTFNDDDDYNVEFKRRGRYVYVYLDDEDEIDAGRYSKDDTDYNYENDYDYDYDSDPGSKYSDFDYDYDDVDNSYGGDLGMDDDFDLGTSDGGFEFDDDDFDIDRDDEDYGRRRKNRRRNRGSRERRRGGRGTQRRGGHYGGDRVRTLSAGRERPSVEDVEFDDASAKPEEIPSGYFGEEEPLATPSRAGSRGSISGSGGSSIFASGSIDFPGFRLVISEASEWWKYDKNVCLNKEFLNPAESEDEGLDTEISIFTVRCSDISTVEHSCNITQWNGTMTTAFRLTYTCCRGYTRLTNDRGCPRKSVESSTGKISLGDLLQSQNYSQKVIDLFNTVLTNDTKKQWTVFVPSKEALDAALKKVDFRESREEPVPEWFVRTVLNHFAQPALSTQAMRHGQQLPTLAKTGGGLLITKTRRGEVLANCQPIIKANQVFNQYSLVHFSSAVLVIQQSSLYQLMLKRLEGVVPADTAVRLLAPVKPVLTGARPVTVFMHLPSKDEIANNCYARNLRSAMVFGAECNASLLSTFGSLRSIDGKFLRLKKGPEGITVGGNRVLLSTDQMASNGILHFVNATESLIGYANEVTRRLMASDVFKPLFTRPGRVEGSLVMLIPPNNGSYTYANTSARWENATKLVAFGRRHLVDNATAMMGRSVKLAMLDGVRREFAQLITRQESASVFGPDRLVRYRFVDCVRVIGMAKDCSGTVYQFLKGELPDFNSSVTAMEYLGRDLTKYTWVRKILAFELERNLTTSELNSRLRRSDMSMVLLKDEDMQRLTGGLISRRRTPTDEQMAKLAAWFGKYLVASKQICAAKAIIPTLTVPVFNIDRRPCRSMICAFRRRVNTADVKRVQLRMDSRVVIKEGFLLPGQLTP